MKELRKIDLRGSDIEELLIEILELKSLERLDLRWNKNISKPEWLDQLDEECIVYF